MSSPVEPKFSWRGVVLIAIAFALVGFAVLFRGGDAPVGSAHWQLTWQLVAAMLRVVGASLLIVVAALLGGWFAYIHAISRLRKEKSRLDDARAATRKA